MLVSKDYKFGGGAYTTRKRTNVIRSGSFMSLYLVAYHLLLVSDVLGKGESLDTYVIGMQAKMLTRLKLN